MAYRIPDSTLAKIQDSNDIVEVISDYMVLKKGGANFKALCPFHQERTPSFMVSPSRQIFKCFGCGAGGNVFGFLMKHEKMTFLEAVRTLAERAGVTFRLPAERAEPQRNLTLREANRMAAEYFYQCMWDPKAGSRALKYLRGRRIEEDSLRRFGLGYAPQAYPGFLRKVEGKVGREFLRGAGLVGEGTGDGGGLFPRFRDRIMFPICGLRGNVLGFGARRLGEGVPKYTNSPETEIYHKGSLLYGLDLAKDTIRKADRAIVVEGYLDVIQAHQAGLSNVVASLGTSLTDGQVGLLRRYTREVVILFDPDTAGEAATMRGLDLCIESGLRVRVGSLPGMDPDDYIRKKGVEALGQVVIQASDFLDFKLSVLQKRFDSKSIEGQVAIINEMLATISKVRNAVERGDYVRRLAEAVDVGEESILIELNKMKRGRRRRGVSIKDVGSLPPLATERDLLALALQNGELLGIAREELREEDFFDLDYRRIFQLIGGMKEVNAQTLINRLEDEKLAGIVADLIIKEIPSQDDGKVARDCIRKIRRRTRQRKKEELLGRIKEAEGDGKTGDLKELLREYQQLIREK